MTLATVLVALALAPVLSGMGGDARPRDPSASSSTVVRASDAPKQALGTDTGDQTAQACEWSCRACEADQGCRQVCTEIGDCGNSCGVTARCDSQHEWSDDACACVLR